MDVNLNLSRFKPALDVNSQPVCAEFWDFNRAYKMMAGLTVKAINNYPDGAIPWAMVKAPELYECQCEAERCLDAAFERNDLAGVRECCRNYAEALKAVFLAFKKDQELVGTQYALVGA